MTQYTSLAISTGSLLSKSEEITRFLDRRSSAIIFFPAIIEADIDYKTFCNHYNSIKAYASSFPDSDDSYIIKEKIAELPDIRSSDFEFYSWEIPTYIFFLLLPVGAIVWLNIYLKINSLLNKLRDMNGQLGTVIFYLKAQDNSIRIRINK